MSEKWDFSSCFLQAGCSARRQGRRAVLGVVRWGIRLTRPLVAGVGEWRGGGDPSRMRQARESSHSSQVLSPSCAGLCAQTHRRPRPPREAGPVFTPHIRMGKPRHWERK